MRTRLILITSLICLIFASCEYDNFDAPNVTLSGKVVYNGNPVGTRTNGTQLELWQDGHQLKEKISVYIAHDGTYSASLFKGQYKVVRLAGAPWEAQSNDTIIIDVNGNTIKDIEVIPYYIIRNESFRKEGSNKVTANFTIDKIASDAELAEVRLYFGKNILTDQNYNEFSVNVEISDITSGQEVSIPVTLPENLVGESYLFVRVGVRSDQSNEFYYTQVQKL